MLIEIQCSNLSGFDSAAGNYVKCGEKIIVSSEQIGQFVTCTKCGQPIEVLARSASVDLERAKRTSKAKATAASGDELRLAAPLERERSDVMALDFAQSHIESKLNQDQHDRCSKCGNISKSGKCTVCRHVESSFEKRHQPLEKVKIELTGFQRWFCRTMSEGVSIKFLEYGAHAGLGFIAVGTTFLSVLGVCGLAFGVVPGLILLFLTICATALYIAFIVKGKQFRTDPLAKLAWFQKPFWYGVLALSRAMNWQAYDSNLKNRRITKVRDKAFGDVEFANIEGLRNVQVLDLQGTSITDASLQMLYGHKHLQCLVLKGTNTTHEAVFRLQQSHPRLWIWE